MCFVTEIGMSVCRFMYPFHRSSAGVVHVLEGGIPSESFGGGAGNARYARHAAGGTFTGKKLFEDGAVEVFFFVLRRVDREAPGGIRHFSVLLLLHPGAACFPRP